jgi:hypothetical protein
MGEELIGPLVMAVIVLGRSAALVIGANVFIPFVLDQIV